MACRERRTSASGFWFLNVLLLFTVLVDTTAYEMRPKQQQQQEQRHKNAYATMMYMGTPRDYEYYMATRVMLRSLARLHVDADLVVIASLDVPLRWVRALEQEDGAKVVRVPNINNPYKTQANFDRRFKLTLNKLYAWNLVEYDRVVMLDSDNLFLQKTDELFQCGQFCAVFINPCIFHTGLFVLQPSKVVFRDMIHELETGRENPDGADQGFIVSYYPDLLDRPLYHPPANGTKLDGTYRLPLGYQMDATYYYLRLRWNVPCGPNSVITFPGAPWLKPWYWWSWPVLPLGISWHEIRRQTLGYGAEIPVALIQAAIYFWVLALTRLARPIIPKLFCLRAEKSVSLIRAGLKLAAIWSILAAYILPFFFVPTTLHPLVAWPLYFLGSFALSTVAINSFLLPVLPVLAPWLLTLGSLLVMACPWYSDGVVRALAVFFYALCSAPIVWASFTKIMSSLKVSLEKEVYFPIVGESSPPSSGFSKSY